MDHTSAKSATVVRKDVHVPLESVLCTDELRLRPSRPPDYQTENRALAALVNALADSPDSILQTLADTILDVFQADSAGVSLLTTHDGGKRFYWPAIAGAWKRHTGGGTPRDFGPCGDVLDRNVPLLFKHFERRYPYLQQTTPAAEEALLVPFYVEGEAVGTIWAMAHDDRRRFDAEDLRQLESLGRFASAAYRTVGVRHSDDVRRAALNLMEDAIHARDAVEQLNVELRESEEALRRNAETFSKFVERAPFGIYSVDSQFRIHQVNAGAQGVFSNVRPLIGRDFGEAIRIIWPEPFASEVSDIFQRVLDTGEPYLAPSLTAERHDVDVVESYEWQVHRVTLADGQLGVVCYFFDATRLREIEAAVRESEENFRALADNIAQFAWTADAKGAIYWYNKRWYDYTGTTFDEVQGSGWQKVHHPDHLDHVMASIQRSLDSGEAWEETFPLRGKDGNYRWFLSRSVPIRDAEGNVVRWSGTDTDITEQRELEDELRRSAADLAEADRRKNEFLATLAHELRNPLAPIRNALEIMRLTPGDAEAAGMASAMMERQVRQMVRLVDDLLDVGRISHGRIELRMAPVELALALQPAVEAARGLCASKGVELSVAWPPETVVVNADSIRIAQVLGNLLNNACKFTNRGGRVELSVVRDNDEAVIRVRDSGVGIAAEDLARIFEMFVQVDTSLERSVAGLGIGLTLAKDLVERHGGTLRARSAGAGEGSEFEVRLPIGSETLPPAEQRGSEPPTVTARRILVVDDNQDSATSLAMLLELAGNETRLAHDGLEAVEAAATFRPHVALLDIGLPKLNGYEVARRIREQPWGKDMVLVALTGWGQKEDRQKSKEAGFDVHLVKPADHAAIMGVLVHGSARGDSWGTSPPWSSDSIR